MEVTNSHSLIITKTDSKYKAFCTQIQTVFHYLRVHIAPAEMKSNQLEIF